MRKKHNKQKRIARLQGAASRYTIKNLAVLYCTTLEGCVILDTKRMCLIKCTQDIVDALSHEYPWTVFMSVMCNSGGENWMKTSEIKTVEKYHHTDLAEVLTKHHMDLIDSVNKNHIKSIGWIASPEGRQFTEKEADGIFSSVDAWLEENAA